MSRQIPPAKRCFASGQFASMYARLRGKHYPERVECPSCGKTVQLKPHFFKGALSMIPHHNIPESKP